MINIIKDGDEHEVWLDTDGGERDGICLAASKYRQLALNQALRVLDTAKEDILTEISAPNV